MKILIDMNLSPSWVEVFRNAGIESVHWSTIGRPTATDREIINYATKNNYIIFTHDLDFGSILASSKTKAPSVIQIRGQDIMPSAIGETVLTALTKFEQILSEGALIIIDKIKLRARILPLKK